MVKIEIVADNIPALINELRFALETFMGVPQPADEIIPVPEPAVSVDIADETRQDVVASPVEDPTDAAMERATRRRGRKASKDAATGDTLPSEPAQSPQPSAATGEAPAETTETTETAETTKTNENAGEVLTVSDAVAQLTEIFKTGSESVRETILTWKANEKLQFVKDMTDEQLPSARGLINVLTGRI